MISDSLRNKVEKLIGRAIKNIQSVSGGSINQAARITTDAGKIFFIKWNAAAASDMFVKEKKGLTLLRSVDSGLRIPEVITTGSANDGIDFIVMEYIGNSTANTDSPKKFARRLARLHQNTAEHYGLNHDNYIGKLPQSNRKHANWIDFFVEERLKPQVHKAVDEGKLTLEIQESFKRLYRKLPDILTDEPPALLHGDLWGGNYFYDTEGEPVICDPAVYYGNREIEIAFTHLFGGFSPAFYNAYEEVLPLQPGFMKERKDIYNLYPLLVHTNLFGGSYARQVEAILKRF